MPQWRKLYTKSLDSIDINDMPNDFARLMWLLLPLGLDREGRGLNNPTWIRSKIFPLREDVTPDMIAQALAWYSEHDMIQCYSIDGRDYFYVTNWQKYQGDCSREKESEIPAPIEQIRTNSGLTQDLLTERFCSDSDSDSDADADADSKTIAAKDAASAKPRKRTERQEALSTLENDFSSITAIPLPGRATYRQKMSASVGWWQPLSQIWELENRNIELARSLIRSAVEKMRRDSLTIAAPRSILKVAISIHGNGNGARQTTSVDRATEKTRELLRKRQNGNG